MTLNAIILPLMLVIHAYCWILALNQIFRLRLPEAHWLRRLNEKACSPVLGPMRRALPFEKMPVDLSPALAIMLLWMAMGVILYIAIANASGM